MIGEVSVPVQPDRNEGFKEGEQIDPPIAPFL